MYAKYAAVEAVVRDDMIKCPHCAGLRQVEYGVWGKTACCEQCSLGMQVTEILPTSIDQKLFWGIMDTRQLSQWLYVAWNISILSDFRDHLEAVQFRCKCGRQLTAKSNGHIIQIGVLQEVAIICRTCFDHKYGGTKDLWDGRLDKLSSDAPLLKVNRRGYAFAAAFRRQVEYAPFGRWLMPLGCSCPHCGKTSTTITDRDVPIQNFPNGKLVRCDSCRGMFTVPPIRGWS